MIATKLKSAFTQQFRQPSGPLGALAGKIMARKNRQRIHWIVSQLMIGPDQQVLEIGHGPGVALQEIASRAPSCRITGIDPSAVMSAQAARRNRQHLAEGRLLLHTLSAEEYTGEESPFDLVFAINVMAFCQDPPQLMKKMVSWLKPGGRIVIAHQIPMQAVEQAVIDAREIAFSGLLVEAGLQPARVLQLPAKPNPVLFIEGVNAEI